jgi:hypothetical protein
MIDEVQEVIFSAPTIQVMSDPVLLQQVEFSMENYTCDPTPRNELLCAFEKSEKKGKVKKILFLEYTLCILSK